MHGVSAISELVDCGWEWSSVSNTLVGGIVVSGTLSTVSQSVNSPFSRSSSESSSALIIVISQRSSGREGLAAVLSARGVAQLVGLIKNKFWNG